LKGKHLHIISFDVPFPANYGGVIDVYYKIKALHEIGVKIHLHCFEYGRTPQKMLNDLCESVQYYHRKTNKSLLFNGIPYIVLSRTDDHLLEVLKKDEYPILMEGLHSTYYLDHPDLKNRVKIVRTHNVEHHYYQSLANVEQNIFKRYYFYNEANKLQKYEGILNKTTAIATISENDKEYFASKYKNVVCIPAFHPNKAVDIKSGLGNYAFYHGNLAVGENNEAALFLVNEVFNDLDIPLIIAGSKPSKELVKAANNNPGIQLKAGISTENIYKLLDDAQISILPTFQSTGIKLKLLAALFHGRHCIVNTPMVEKTGLESLCIIADDATEMKKQLKRVFKLELSNQEIEKRKLILEDKFSNHKNAELLSRLLAGNRAKTLAVQPV
jgi:hypothetical protein